MNELIDSEKILKGMERMFTPVEMEEFRSNNDWVEKLCRGFWMNKEPESNN